jgi:predicted Zn-dependent protease
MRHLIFLFLIFCPLLIHAQKASIKEEKISFKTYPYSDPDPVAKMTKHYPYFRFDGFTNTAIDKEWNFVVLENDYIKVYVAPEMGGKVWGAIEKSTGEDFIYFNESVKFRDISMRGAWTSGGIEFNFGSIGHAPSTASPVNYKLVENSDGSVSCFVGAPDLTSRTEWRVEVRLPADKAYFVTNGLWYNPTGERTSLYNWMTSATDATDDMEFCFPSHTEIGHGGEAGQWPVNEEDRSISFYKNNNFGGPKSYHVLGSFEEYFGTFFHDKNFGTGHWAPREERPGQKIWIWGLSRSGEIWVDILSDTNTNVQYTELQTGFLYNQAARNSTYTPYKHLFLEANSENQFSEIWFPVKGTNGMAKADQYGTLNIIETNDQPTIKFCALQKIEGQLIVKTDGKELLRKEILLKPMELFEQPLDMSVTNDYTIDIAGVFHYSSTERKDKLLSRPTLLDDAFDWNSVEGLYTEAVELERQRSYAGALEKYEEVLKQQPYHINALVGMANIRYKMMDFGEAEKLSLKALAINTYDPDANFTYGMVCKQFGKKYDALEGFGFALRSMKYRSAGNLQMAQIYFKDGEMDRAEKYARQSLDYNQYNTEAYLILGLIEKSKGNENKKNEVLSRILEIDPLNVFAHYESKSLSDVMHFEMPHEIGLELAIKYYNLGEKEEAVQILSEIADHPIAKYWLAFLTDNHSVLNEAVAASPAFVYPYRTETAEVLEWAMKLNNSWKTKYYLAILNWSKSNVSEAAELFSLCGSEPEYAPFYLTRGSFYKEFAPDKTEAEFILALSLDNAQWRTYHVLVDLYIAKNKNPEALEMASQAKKRFPENYITGFDYARSLYYNNQYADCLKELKHLNILPNEGSRSGHDIYRSASAMLAIQHYMKGNYSKAITLLDEARKWPENLGVGRPYDADERIEDFLESLCYKQMGNRDKENALKQRVADFTLASVDYNAFMGSNKNSSTLLGAFVIRDLGQKEKADQMMHEWFKGDEKDKIAQWAMAAYSSNFSEAQKLAEDMETTEDGTPWNPSIQDFSFELVKDIYLLINRSL